MQRLTYDQKLIRLVYKFIDGEISGTQYTIEKAKLQEQNKP